MQEELSTLLKNIPDAQEEQSLQLANLKADLDALYAVSQVCLAYGAQASV